jgi:hypothetical protein
MTLSRFLRDYLYVPLGGNRRGSARQYVNVMITMLLGGLWHGANWTFVVWGALHGTYLVINHAWSSTGMKLPRIIAASLTFVAVVVAWVLFRAADFSTALSMLAGMAGSNGVSMPASAAALRQFAPALFDALSIDFTGTLRGWEELPGGAPRLAGYLAIGLALVWTAPNSQRIARYGAEVTRALELPSYRIAAAAGAMLALSVMGLDRVSTFLYYQF